MKSPITKAILIWTVIFLIEAGGIIAFSTLAAGKWQPKTIGPLEFAVIGLLMFASCGVLLSTPIWIMTSCLMVKKAINSAYANDYRYVRILIISRGWLLFPLPRYSHIINILSHLCQNNSILPEGMSGDLAHFIVRNKSGHYSLNLEGREKMLKIVNTGWLNAETGEKFLSAKMTRASIAITAAAALLRAIDLIVHLLEHH